MKWVVVIDTEGKLTLMTRVMRETMIEIYSMMGQYIGSVVLKSFNEYEDGYMFIKRVCEGETILNELNL